MQYNDLSASVQQGVHMYIKAHSLIRNRFILNRYATSFTMKIQLDHYYTFKGFPKLHFMLVLGGALLLINLFEPNLCYSQNTKEAEACIIRIKLSQSLKVVTWMPTKSSPHTATHRRCRGNATLPPR